ncbi:SDR family NAD(P)-dependent oxidoreductase [Propylenella binzhouense]|uniref:SDR family NAD(P)-dependent oxidoreductase n=1 Tax=Propylenella binzhouense TaxID=2555902 RepID=A0A964WTW5_9HYPH|nr:SDR family NAD(P)-dependent oxidoreductase [Propylenella binzhouense]MYZ48426.1 SDR family NAD(P)-dependent oxidoreductase [Propylenella binzhouense]
MAEGVLKDRVAVVTGASRGIGYFAAKALAEAGAHVVAVARTVGGLEELDDEIQAAGGSSTLVPLDLRDYDGIDRLGAAIFERWGRLDVLVGNAGVLGQLSPLGHIPPKVWDEAMAINVTANWRLIRSFDPLLRQSDAGRAIFLTSGAARNCRAFWGTYSVTKAALEALARTYAAESRKTRIRVTLVNPGPMRTAMRGKAMPGEDPATLPHPSAIAPAIVRFAAPGHDVPLGRFDFPSGSLVSLLEAG